MLQAHKGYFRESGQFVPENLEAKIPPNQQVIILWDDESPRSKKLDQSQRETAQNFLMAIQKMRKDLTPEDNDALDELESGKYKLILEDRSAEL